MAKIPGVGTKNVTGFGVHSKFFTPTAPKGRLDLGGSKPPKLPSPLPKLPKLPKFLK